MCQGDRGGQGVSTECGNAVGEKCVGQGHSSAGRFNASDFLIFYSRDIAFGRWVLGPLLRDKSERNILSMASFGRGHIFNQVSDVTFVFLVQLYDNDFSANQKRTLH